MKRETEKPNTDSSGGNVGFSISPNEDSAVFKAYVYDRVKMAEDESNLVTLDELFDLAHAEIKRRRECVA